MQVFDVTEKRLYPAVPAFAPDGRLLAVWLWGRVHVFDTAAGALRTVLGAHDAGLNAVPGIGFTADGRAVVAYRFYLKPQVQVYDLDTGATLRQCPKLHGFACAVGPGGRLAYLSVYRKDHRSAVVRWDPLTDEVQPPVADHKGQVRQLAVSADERWLATSDGYDIRVWNLGGPKPAARAARQFKLNDGDGLIWGVALSPDGAFVAWSRATAGAVKSIGVGAVRGGEWWDVPGAGTSWGAGAAFHPSRPLLACAAGEEVLLYDPLARTELKRFAWGVGEVTAVCFSPDGLRCAAVGRGKVVVWDVDL